MTKLEELEKQREELDKEIERLKRDVTTGPIYLMSVEEYEKYENKIPCWGTWWWLRTPGMYQDWVTNVCDFGSINYSGNYVYSGGGCVRPILNEVNMSEKDRLRIVFVDGNDRRMTFCGITWDKLDDGLWIAESPITTRRFDKKSNNYAESEVRQFLLSWYNDRKGW